MFLDGLLAVLRWSRYVGGNTVVSSLRCEQTLNKIIAMISVKRSLVVLGQVFWCALWTNTPPTWYSGLCPVYWVGGLLFDARHQKSDLARQSAREKGEVKVGKGGKGRVLER